jgi:hypothetical protein
MPVDSIPNHYPFERQLNGMCYKCPWQVSRVSRCFKPVSGDENLSSLLPVCLAAGNDTETMRSDLHGSRGHGSQKISWRNVQRFKQAVMMPRRGLHRAVQKAPRERVERVGVVWFVPCVHFGIRLPLVHERWLFSENSRLLSAGKFCRQRES